MRYKKSTLALIGGGTVLAASLSYYLFSGSNNFSKDNENKTDNKVIQEATSNDTGGQNIPTPTPTPTQTKIQEGGVYINEPSVGSQIQPGSTVVRGEVTSSNGGDLYYMVKGLKSGIMADYKIATVPANSVNFQYSAKINFERYPKSSEGAVLEVYLMSGNERLGYADVGVQI